MEIFISNFFSNDSILLAFAAVVITALGCVFGVLLTVRSKARFSGGCGCSRKGSGGNSEKTTSYWNGGSNSNSFGGELKGEEESRSGEEMVEKLAAAVAKEKQSGASMMEQLVPEITTHALSYLDYPSLCRLSMTNSLMRKAANDDNAWKALYHKDFTLEQDSVTPVNGWKAYYAGTRAIVNVNNEFFRIIKERSLTEMGHFWLNADYVKCFHASGEIFTGFNAVMQSWQLAFNWEHNFNVQEVRTRVLTDVAWVTMKAYVNVEVGPFSMSNIFELHNGRWYMVHHHSSVMLVNGGAEQQMMHG
ncbi:hypothetical protein ACH5RR_041734 [Cinchona calisaya]|uniref:F-box domain-containing protein n=1 Tax=Cinchona calisaya TaxID=153742 RepID=A0ABD2XUD8_9GENT